MSSRKKNKNTGNETKPQSSPQATTTHSQQMSRSPSSYSHGKQNANHAPNGWRSTLIRLRKSHVPQIALIVLLAALPSLYFYNSSRQAEQKLNGSTSTNLQTTAEVVKRVSRHILLPSGEQPTVATVSDANKVRGQAFFVNAASGDKVLIYAQAKKAYLYRPSIDRIIEVAPLAPSKTGP